VIQASVIAAHVAVRELLGDDGDEPAGDGPESVSTSEAGRRSLTAVEGVQPTIVSGDSDVFLRVRVPSDRVALLVVEVAVESDFDVGQCD
jgi:hypothetical protein